MLPRHDGVVVAGAIVQGSQKEPLPPWKKHVLQPILHMPHLVDPLEITGTGVT